MTLKEIRYNEIVNQFLEYVPEYANVYREHEQEYEEILYYTLFGGDLIKFIAELYESSTKHHEHSEQKDVLRRVFEFIEAGANSNDERVVSIIQVGFLETLHLVGDSYESIKLMLGSKSKVLFEKMELGWQNVSQRQNQPPKDIK